MSRCGTTRAAFCQTIPRALCGTARTGLAARRLVYVSFAAHMPLLVQLMGSAGEATAASSALLCHVPAETTRRGSALAQHEVRGTPRRCSFLLRSTRPRQEPIPARPSSPALLPGPRPDHSPRLPAQVRGARAPRRLPLPRCARRALASDAPARQLAVSARLRCSNAVVAAAEQSSGPAGAGAAELRQQKPRPAATSLF